MPCSRHHVTALSIVLACRDPRLPLIARPVEREDREVEQVAETLLPELALVELAAPDQIERDAAEQELMRNLADLHRRSRYRLSLTILERNDRLHLAVLLHAAPGFRQEFGLDLLRIRAAHR